MLNHSIIIKRFTYFLMVCSFLCCTPVNAQSAINLLFVGNSITYGDQLSDPLTQAPPAICRAIVEDATGLTTNMYNGGHCGITTWGFLPGREDFTRLLDKAKDFQDQYGGMMYFSIMLGTNDSAMSATEGAPVSQDTYGKNIRAIIEQLNIEFPKCKILLNYPLWYSATTHNGAMYLQEGQDRLRSYYPILDQIVTEYANVYAGRRDVWEMYEDNYGLFTKEMGYSGYFYLHPNADGAKVLGGIWANSILELIQADGIAVKK